MRHLRPRRLPLRSGSAWLPPGTPSTWVCSCGGINPRTSTTCHKCSQ
ncbi:hypothetical protein N5079_04970 [Planotetraspora sp. A-T 1434]|nr:hypothetical protein [Planotetraspora sp. A-T 1434]MCT9929569.1 hypothetical protein [Planotetraspora sp. A-T 1434]